MPQLTPCGWSSLVLALVLAGCAAVAPRQERRVSREESLQPVRVEGIPKGIVKALSPSNDRDWAPDQAVLAWAEIDGPMVTVHNIRNCTYRSADDYSVSYYDKTFDLRKLDSLDIIMIPFLGMPSLAHTMISFGFEGKEYLGVSVEIRKERGESYAPLKGIFRQFELMYVVGDERDLIRLCTDYYMNGVYLYPVKASNEEMRAIFLDVMERVNRLREQPEFYNTFTNNCTTNIVRHINRAGFRKLPYDYRVLFPGYFDRLIYEEGMIDNSLSLPQTRLRARINPLAYLYRDDPEFSVKIRR